MSNKKSSSSLVLAKCQNSKINKFIEDINKKTFQRDIVLLLIDIAEKPDISIDYNISLSHYLALYINCKEEPVLSEAACLILNAAKIYARRIDNIHDCVARILSGFEEVSNNIEKEISNDTTETKRKCNKRSLPSQDYLQEYDLCPKKFKKLTDEKLCDNDVTHNFEAPKRYFIDLKTYKEWRLNNKKRNKQCTKMDNDFIDPAQWKCSSIEDFDYEDDIDTKRNYRIYTNFMEPRYSTLINDINFIMHFKVKDYIEAEEEEIENQILLGLPLAPKRDWPPLCKYRTNITDKDDYIKNYIDLENTVLEKENEQNSNCFDFIRKRKRCHQLELNNISSPKRIALTNEILDNNNEIANNNDEISNNNDAISNNDEISMFDVPDLTISNNTKENETNITIDQSENFDPENILVRLSMDDEGIFFCDLDDVDRAMLSPRVVATNIASSMENDIANISKIRVNVDNDFEKFFGIDESNSIVNENLIKQPEINLNFLKIPKKLLYKRRLFNLPDNYDIHKKNRIIKCRRTKDNSEKTQILNLNETKLSKNPTISDSPSHEPFFYGFSEDEMEDSTKSIKENVKNYDKFRNLSFDSGIDGREISDNLTITNTSFENSTLLSTDENFNDTTIISSIDDDHACNDNINNEITETEIDIFENTNLKNNHVNEMIMKIQNWHRYLKPILAKSKDRHHFDVFVLGTEIINEFPIENSSECNKDVSFKKVMNNKDPSFTSRYFLSMLLLANANNISIKIDNENDNTPSKAEDIKLQLINRKRYTVSMEDNIGMTSSKRISNSNKSVIFPKPNHKSFLVNKGKTNDDNDSGFYSHDSFDSNII